MLAIIVISLLVLIGAALSVFLWQRTLPGTREDHNLEPPHFGGLFDERGSERAQVGGGEKGIAGVRAALLERARRGELEALSEALTGGDAEMYGEVLDALVDSVSGRQKEFLALVSHISKSNELRG